MKRRTFVSGLAAAAFTVPRLEAYAADSTPEADPLAGLSIEPLGGGESIEANGHSLALMRLTLVPGTLISEHHHPGSVMLAVQSGVFTTTFTQGSAVITRSATADAAGAVEPVIIGAESVLEAGDSVYYERDTYHTMSNHTDEPLVLLAAVILDVGADGFLFKHAM